MTLASDAAPATLHPLFAQLVARHGFAEVAAANFDAFAKTPGRVVLLFLEDPLRYKESLDLAVILPEIASAFPGRFAVGVLFPEAARAFATRYGFRRWPALVMLKDGGYVGTIDGLRSWDEYLQQTAALLEAPVTRPPSVGIAVMEAGSAGGCAH